jgi:hypothetical protein
MAKEVLVNSSILVNSVNLSDHCSSISIEDSAGEVDVTSFSASEYSEFIAGLKDATISASFFNDHAAGSVADTLQPLYDSGGTFSVRVKPDVQGTVAYSMVSRLYTNPLLSGAVGEANTIDVTFRHGGTAGVTRGSVAAGTP